VDEDYDLDRMVRCFSASLLRFFCNAPFDERSVAISRKCARAARISRWIPTCRALVHSWFVDRDTHQHAFVVTRRHVERWREARV